MSLMNTLRNNMKLLLYFIVCGFLISMFAGLGTYIMSQKQNTVAIVNGEKIKTSEFDKLYNNTLSADDSEKNPEDIKKIKEKTLRALMQEKLMFQEATKLGDVVSDNEVRQQISRYPLFQINNQFSPNEYKKKLKYVLRQTSEEFENNIKNQILIEKTKYLIASSIKSSTNELKIEFETIKPMLDDKVPFEEFAKKYSTNKQYLLLNGWFKNTAAIADTKITHENK